MLLIYILLFLVLLLCVTHGSEEDPEFKPIKFVPHYSRLLPEKQAKYTKRSVYEKIALKLGQRKLLMNELEFYTEFADNNTVVIYAGAAAGIHSVAFARLFEKVHFIFYDPNKFFDGLADCPNIETHQEFFTDEIASDLQKKYKHKRILFLSDIRSGTEEEYVQKNMDMQKNWCFIIKPYRAMLKFRLPWQPGKTEYFKGDIYTQPRIGATSTETRLWVSDFSMKKYDNEVYNNQVFYYQKYCRNAFHDLEHHDIAGLDHCHDCWSEIQICKQYVKKYSDIFSDVTELMEYLSVCSSNINISPHGELPEEKNINKKIKILSNDTINYMSSLIDKKARFN